MKKSTISSSIAVALGVAAFSVQAELTNTAVLEFDQGVVTTSCSIPDGNVPPNCSYGAESSVTTGSFFTMDANGNGQIDPGETTLIGPNDGITIGVLQSASGSHTGGPNGTENPGLDAPWAFFCNTGMHFTSGSPITVVNDNGTQKDLDFSGWRVTWSGIPEINMGGGIQDCGTTNDGICGTGPNDIGGTIDNGSQLASITCSTASCSQSSTFVLDYAATVPQDDPSGFGGVPYTLHMEGHIGTAAIPVPAAVWLFGSGLLGLVGVARRRKK